MNANCLQNLCQNVLRRKWRTRVWYCKIQYQTHVRTKANSRHQRAETHENTYETTLEKCAAKSLRGPTFATLFSIEKIQKNTKNRFKIDLKSILGAQRRSKAVLGAFRARLGCLLARFGRRLGAQDHPKMEQKSMQNRIDFLMPLEVGFLIDFGSPD